MTKFDIKQLCGIEFPNSKLICELEIKHSGNCKNQNSYIVECTVCDSNQSLNTIKSVDWWVCNQCGIINSFKITTLSVRC